VVPAAHPTSLHTRFANVNFGPTGFTSQRALSYPSGIRSAHTDRLPPARPCQVHFGNSTDYRSDNSRPPTVDTSADHMDPTNMGGLFSFFTSPVKVAMVIMLERMPKRGGERRKRPLHTVDAPDFRSPGVKNLVDTVFSCLPMFKPIPPSEIAIDH
jgi:hypothetical protein